MGHEALHRAAPQLRAQLDSACAAALNDALTAAAVPHEHHASVMRAALSGDGAQVRYAADTAPHLAAADAGALAQLALLPVELAGPALLDVLAKATRRAALHEWQALAAGGADPRHGASAMASMGAGLADGARRRVALQRLATDMQQALRSAAETAECVARETADNVRAPSSQSADRGTPATPPAPALCL